MLLVQMETLAREAILNVMTEYNICCLSRRIASVTTKDVSSVATETRLLMTQQTLSSVITLSVASLARISAHSSNLRLP